MWRIKIKRAFTLFELIIVIVLISIIYYFTLSNFSIKQAKLDSVTLMNLKQTLSKFEFDEKVSLHCIDDKDIDCLISIDGEIQKERITKLFEKCPDVYEYSKDQKKIEFSDLELEKLEYYPICFEYELNKNGQSSQMIVDIIGDVFIFDNISSKPKRIQYINDIGLYFDEKSNEVKDAF